MSSVVVTASYGGISFILLIIVIVILIRGA